MNSLSVSRARLGTKYRGILSFDLICLPFYQKGNQSKSHGNKSYDKIPRYFVPSVARRSCFSLSRVQPFFNCENVT